MANYDCTIVSNYFRVKDEEAYQKWLSCLSSEYIEDFSYTDRETGELYHGFGSYGSLWFCYDKYRELNRIIDCRNTSNAFSDMDDIDEIDYEMLKKMIDQRDVAIIKEVGNEKMRYVVGAVVVISNEEARYMDIESWADEAAKDMLKKRGG